MREVETCSSFDGLYVKKYVILIFSAFVGKNLVKKNIVILCYCGMIFN